MYGARMITPRRSKCHKTVKAPWHVVSACYDVVPHLWNTDVRVNDFIKDETPFRESRQTIREFLIKEGANFYYSISYNHETKSFNFILSEEELGNEH